MVTRARDQHAGETCNVPRSGTRGVVRTVRTRWKERAKLLGYRHVVYDVLVPGDWRNFTGAVDFNVAISAGFRTLNLIVDNVVKAAAPRVIVHIAPTTRTTNVLHRRTRVREEETRRNRIDTEDKERGATSATGWPVHKQRGLPVNSP